MTKLYVAGEGPCEIGRWAESPEHRASSQRSDGVLAALFVRAGREGTVIDGKCWMHVRKYRAGGHATAEQRTLRALVLDAQEAGADALLWVRDTDHDEDREKQLTTEHRRLKEEHADALEIVGWPAVPAIEAWILAIGRHVSAPEGLSVPKLKQLAEQHSVDREQAMVELIAHWDLDTTRSPSLKQWIDQLSPKR